MRLASTGEVFERKFTVGESAKMLHVSTTSIHRYIHSGQLEAYRIGRLFRIPMRSLRAFVGDGYLDFSEDTK